MCLTVSKSVSSIRIAVPATGPTSSVPRWLDIRHRSQLILPTFLAFNFILLALRFLYWDFGVKHRERGRQQRLEAHRLREGGHA